MAIVFAMRANWNPRIWEMINQRPKRMIRHQSLNPNLRKKLPNHLLGISCLTWKTSTARFAEWESNKASPLYVRKVDILESVQTIGLRSICKFLAKLPKLRSFANPTVNQVRNTTRCICSVTARPSTARFPPTLQPITKSAIGSVLRLS